VVVVASELLFVLFLVKLSDLIVGQWNNVVGW
jgi:hypothetical protein